MSEREKRRHKIDDLPSTLSEAIDELEKDKVILDALGPHLAESYVAAKRQVWTEFLAQVHPWELDRYSGVLLEGVHVGRGAMDRFVSLDDLLRPDVDYARPPRGGRDFFDLLGELGGKRILDVGCGIGAYRAPLESRGAIWVGLDLTGPAAHVIGDANRLPFRDGAFDGIMCSAVLEHLPEPGVMMTEVRRVLREDGLLFGYVAFLEPFHGISYYHMSHMGLEYLLRKHGFRPQRIFPSHVGAGYQLDSLFFPRRVPLAQPLCRTVTRGWLAAAMALNRVARQALLALQRRPEAGDPENRRKYRQLLALKFSVGFNFVAKRGAIPDAVALGYRSLIKEG